MALTVSVTTLQREDKAKKIEFLIDRCDGKRHIIESVFITLYQSHSHYFSSIFLEVVNTF